MKKLITYLLLIIVSQSCFAQANVSLKDKYTKLERMIPMRDGVQLFTSIYVPKDQNEKVPFLIERTPYSCFPYGEANYPRRLGPSLLFANEKFIYIRQDVRGRYMSEGNFEEMTPALTNSSTKKTDESTDCFDTIEWLLKNIENNNGNAGLYGISYPGFYATASLPNAHPALKAVSPQAPVTDEFEGDDAYHRGAFFLMDNFGFMNGFDHPRSKPWTQYPKIFEDSKKDAYEFFLNLGPLKNANDRYFLHKSKIWDEYLKHDTKDKYWQERDIRTHLKNIKPAVLLVGGWFDAEDLFGSLKTYEAIEKQNPSNKAQLIMGPWTHGAWSRSDWSKYGTMKFGSNTSQYFQQMEFDFFNFYLKGKGKYQPVEATIFETGTNKWKTHETWPPKNATQSTWTLGSDNLLLIDGAAKASGFDEYVSDPADPVPYMYTTGSGRNNEYMIADQLFASQRKDVVTYQSTALENNQVLAGPVTADLYLSTTSTDADFIVKLIDVLPDTATDTNGRNIGGMQRLVRAEVLRGKFRESFTNPVAFVPGKVTNVKFSLNDVSHCFTKGHKIMVQVQSSWFPLIDRNPQTFMSIPQASAFNFQKATIQIHHSSKYPSSIKVSTTKE